MECENKKQEKLAPRNLALASLSYMYLNYCRDKNTNIKISMPKSNRTALKYSYLFTFYLMGTFIGMAIMEKEYFAIPKSILLFEFMRFLIVYRVMKRSKFYKVAYSLHRNEKYTIE